MASWWLILKSVLEIFMREYRNSRLENQTIRLMGSVPISIIIEKKCSQNDIDGFEVLENDEGIDNYMSP
jgi:hypothetical protein